MNTWSQYMHGYAIIYGTTMDLMDTQFCMGLWFGLGGTVVYS